MSIIININNKLNVYYFNETNDFINNNCQKITSYNDMISIINKHYNNNNNNNNLVIICNFSINMSIKYLASNERFKYNYYVFFKEQYDDCKMVPTITWGSFYSSFCKVPNNIE